MTCLRAFCSNAVNFQLFLLSSYAARNSSTKLNSTRKNPQEEKGGVFAKEVREILSRDVVSEVSGWRICCRDTFSVTELQQRSMDIPAKPSKEGFSPAFS